MDYGFKFTLNSLISDVISEQMDGKVMSWERQMAAHDNERRSSEVSAENQKEVDFYNKYMMVQIPHSESFNSTTLAIPTGSKINVWHHPITPGDFSKDYAAWRGTAWESYIPQNLNEIFPEGSLRSFTVPQGVKYSTHIKRISDPPNLKYAFDWFYNQDGQPYKQNFVSGEIPKSLTPEEKTWWSEWGPVILNVTASLAAAWMTGGLSVWVQIGVQVGIDLGFAGYQLEQGDKFGASISAILAIIPLASKILKIGEVSGTVLASLTKKVGSCSDITALETTYAGLSSVEKIAFRKVFSNQSQEIVRATSRTFYNRIRVALKQGTFKMESIPIAQRKSVRELLFQLMVTGGVFGGSLVYINKEADRMMAEMEKQNGDMQIPMKLDPSVMGTEEEAIAWEKEYDKKHPKKTN
jgi:hypothetical protein